ncbi:hypothetical protein ACLOJK_038718 [Asimina triloba]
MADIKTAEQHGKAISTFLCRSHCRFAHTSMSEEHTPDPPAPPKAKATLRDIILWSRKKLSFSILLVSTATWVLFEVYQFNFFTAVSWVAIAIVACLFMWTNLVTLAGKDPPSLSNLEISEQSAVEAAETVRTWAQDGVRWLLAVAVRREWYVFCQVVAALLVLSFIGSRLDFLTVLYLAIVLGLTLPVTCIKYEDKLKAFAERVKMGGQRLRQTVDEKVARKLTKKVSKEKKNE